MTDPVMVFMPGGDDAAGRPIFQALQAVADGLIPDLYVEELEGAGDFVLFGAVVAWAMCAGRAMAWLADTTGEEGPVRVASEMVISGPWSDDAVEFRDLAFSVLGALTNGDPAVLGALWETFDDRQRFGCALGLVGMVPSIVSQLAGEQEL